MNFNKKPTDLTMLGEQASPNENILKLIDNVIDFEQFQIDLNQAPPFLPHSATGAKPFDTIILLKILIIQYLYSLSDKRTASIIKDRISFMSFLNILPHEITPSKNQIYKFRIQLNKAIIDGHIAFEVLLERINKAAFQAGYRIKPGRIVEAALVQITNRKSMSSVSRPAPSKNPNTNLTIAQLIKAGAMSKVDLEAAIDDYLSDRAVDRIAIGKYNIDIASAIKSHAFSWVILNSKDPKTRRRRSAVRNAILVIRPISS